jgi:quercetin dioxygenase-like cupin family protein
VSDRFEDERGVIQDLLVRKLDAVTRIDTVKGAIRGNHYHKHTTQWTYVISGRLRIVTHPDWGLAALRQENVYGPGEMACELPNVPHAWEALEDTSVLVFTHGPRSGDAYESDTFRLDPKDRLL